MKKRILTVILCLAMLLSCSLFFSCKKADGRSSINIVTTIFPLYDFAENIAGDRAEVTMLLRSGQDIHSYEPTPQDIVSIGDSTLLLYIGGESDEWISGILSGLSKKPSTLALMDEIPLLHEDEESCEHHHEHEGSGEYDEHIWTSPKRAIYMVEAIINVLSLSDPDGEEIYRKNGEAYLEKLRQLDLDMAMTVQNRSKSSIIVADRFPFLYLTHDYNITAHAALSGCAESTEASAEKVAELVNVGRKDKIGAVLKVEMSNGRLADTVADEIGARVLTLHSCHNLTSDEWNNGVTYISKMYDNIAVLSEALK